jgi:hypothetical protein
MVNLKNFMKQQFYNELLSVKHLCVFLSLLLCVSLKNVAQVYPIDSIMRNGDRTNRVNIVFIADGYTAGQLSTYVTNVTTINNGLFAQTPFAHYKNFFNSFAISTASAESGAKHPGTAGDEGTSGGQPITNPTTFVNTTFDYAGIHRLLVPLNSGTIYTTLANNLPDYDQAFILSNSPYYGGSGGAFATSSINSAATGIAIHEIGHSFAGLADEYWAGPGYASERPNMTANSNPATVKWKNWYGLNNIGIYPYGASGTPALWFRPHQSCKMQYLGQPFCSVCVERFIDRIHQLVNMVDSYLPSTNSFTLINNSDVNFSVDRLNTIPNTITVNWYLNGSATAFATGVDAIAIPFNNLNVGVNTIRAEVVDNTPLSKSYLPGAGYVNNVIWNVTKPSVVPVNLLSFTGSTNSRNEGLLKWKIDNIQDLRYFELERSNNTSSFERLSQVDKITGEQHYAFTDQNLLSPVGYYRLKIINTDGSIQYSNQVALRNSFEKYNYKVYQDADAHLYRLSVNAGDGANIALYVTDAAGRIIKQKQLGTQKNQVNYDIDLAKYPAGIYYMNLQVASGKYTVQLVAK